MHLLTCLVCGEKTDAGPTVLGRLRPLCREDNDGFNASMEYERGEHHTSGAAPLKDSMGFARAFMDWLTRVRAERRNAGQVAA